VLNLIFAHGHRFRPVQKNIGGLEHRVGEEAEVNIRFLALGFFLELGHAFQRPHGRHCI
jgi:hypothetical protein